MDPITHALSGALLFKTYSVFSDTPQTKWVIPLVMLATASPDLDVLYSLTPISYISNHRGISHSIFVMPLFALLLTFLLFPLWKKTTKLAWTFKKTYLFAIILILLHIWLDVVTTYGTMIFMPINDYRVRLNGIFIIDLLLTLPMIFAFFYCKVMYSGHKLESDIPSASNKSIMHISKKNTVLITILIWTLVYPAASVFWRLQLEEQQLHKFASEDEKLLGLTVLADVFSPLNWRLIYATAGITNEIRLKAFDENLIEKYPLSSLNSSVIANFLPKNTVYEQSLLYNGSTHNPKHSFPAANDNLINMLKKSDQNCNTFFKFTLLPVQKIKSWKDGFEFSFYDLRFKTLVPFAQKIFEQRNKNEVANFLLQVRLNEHAQLVGVRVQLTSMDLDSGWNSPDKYSSK